MNRIEEQFNSYRAQVIPTNASEAQVNECRIAFYAGALASFSLIMTTSDPGMSEDVGLKILAGIWQELDQFVSQLESASACKPNLSH